MIEITPFQENQQYIRIIDVAAGLSYNSGTNDLATAYAAAAAGTPGNTVPDSTHPAILDIPPGVFTVADEEVLTLTQAYLHINGAGKDATIIRLNVDSNVAIVRNKAANISNCTLENLAGDVLSDGHADAASALTRNVAFKAATGSYNGACVASPRGRFENIDLLVGATGIDSPQTTFVGTGFRIDGVAAAIGGTIAGGRLNDSDILGTTAGAVATTPAAAFTMRNCYIKAASNETFYTADYLRLINCNVVGVASKAIFGAIAGNNIEVIGGRLEAGSGGSIFEIPSATTRRVSIAGQPRLVGTLKSGAGTFSPSGGGFTILADGTAATYDGVLVYDETADTHKGQQNAVAKTFTVS